jgi:hypothetical protein
MNFFISISLILLFFAFIFIPNTSLEAGIMGAWWACVLWQLNDMNIKLIRYAYKKRNKSTLLSK